MSSSISSITIGPRQSNFELLRILAMFLVLVFHADFWSLGDLTKEDYISNPINAWTRTIIGSFSVICVNVFVLISGYFGIKPSLKGICSYIFQWLFFYIGTFLIMIALGKVSWDYKTLFACFGISNYNWFIKAYLALYIISPILNSFIEHSNRKVIKITLIAFFIFQTIYGWTAASPWVYQGYSAFSFIGLYILARYIKHFGLKRHFWMWLYVVSIIANIPFLAFQMYYNIGPGVHSYVNPLVISGAVGLLGIFSTLRIPVIKQINFIAKSSFAVFLFHHAPAIGKPFFKPLILTLYNDYSGITCILSIAGTLILIFILSIILDQPRKYIWNRVISKLFQ